MNPAKIFGWTVSLAIIVMLTVVPYVYYRQGWAHSKRLRVVTEGKMYRSGCLTAEGFRDAVRRYGIRTIINLRDEAPNPPLLENWFNHHITSEEDLCKQLGVKFVFIELDVLSRDKLAKERPKSIQKYLKVMDDPASYPVLLHCQAGLHRTGVFSAIYRMEYEGWSTEQAMHELREHGFGVYRATAADDYIEQYVLSYHPRERHAKGKRLMTSDEIIAEMPDHSDWEIGLKVVGPPFRAIPASNGLANMNDSDDSLGRLVQVAGKAVDQAPKKVGKLFLNLDQSDRRAVPAYGRCNRIPSIVPPMPDEEKQLREPFGVGWKGFAGDMARQDPIRWMWYYKTCGYRLGSISINGGSQQIRFAPVFVGPAPYGPPQPYGPPPAYGPSPLPQAN